MIRAIIGVDVRSHLLAVLALVALAAFPARAEPTADEVSPRFSFCLGRTAHCVMPALRLSAVTYDLSSLKWEAGAVDAGGGVLLLLWSDRPWASGMAAHLGGRWSEAGTSYLAVTPTLVFFRHLEVGLAIRVADGGPRYLLAVGSSLAWDFLSGRTIGERLADARVASMIESSRARLAGGER